MYIPEFITINQFQFQLWTIFVFVAFVLYLFVVWFEGRKDGFDIEKLFDTAFLGAFSAYIFSKILFKLSLKSAVVKDIDVEIGSLSILGAVLGLGFCLIVLSKTWRWSGYRLLDVFSLSVSAFISLSMLSSFMIYKNINGLYASVLFLGQYLILSRFRNSKLKSGYVFSYSIVISVFIVSLLFEEYRSLIFILLLITMSLVNLIFRERKDMTGRPPISQSLLNSLKNVLLSKGKQLKKEQSILDQIDPANDTDRDIDNADPIDEAVLEDTSKEIVDLRRTSADNMQQLVRKALARMRIGKYGICEVCGKPIEEARLRIYPEATTCTEHMGKE